VDELRRAAEELARLVSEESPDPASLARVRAQIRAVEVELAGPKKRASRGQGGRFVILGYLKSHVGQWVSGDELREVSGIQEWARRVRELRVEDGYPITHGHQGYRLESLDPDAGAANRWRIANDIRRRPGDARDRIAEYFRANVGEAVTLEELHYVARIKEVPRRIRELRDELGMRISSRHARPDLRPNEYLLETLELLPPNERAVKPAIWAAVLERDRHRCVLCGARAGERGRWLEVDHVVEKLDGGSDELDNLQTLCNVDHTAKTAEFHRRRRGGA
jgi:biotin operon repressor